jgi:hypothetical protein
MIVMKSSEPNGSCLGWEKIDWRAGGQCNNEETCQRPVVRWKRDWKDKRKEIVHGSDGAIIDTTELQGNEW